MNTTPAIVFLPGGAEPDDAITIDYKMSTDAQGEERAILDVKRMVRTILERATHPFAEKDDLWEEMEAMASMG